MHEGHRKRMIQKAMVALDSLCDHELLEIILFNTQPRVNTNEIAHRLLDTFGNFWGVLHASLEQLKTVEGVGDSTAVYLKCIANLFSRMELEQELVYPDAKNVKVLADFFERRFRGLSEEVVEIYTADARDKLKFVSRISSHENDRVAVSASHISRVLTSEHPHSIFVVHNHPTQDAKPSLADDTFTKQIQALCVMNGVRFLDHFIVGVSDIYSYHYSGTLEAIKQSITMENILQLANNSRKY